MSDPSVHPRRPGRRLLIAAGLATMIGAFSAGVAAHAWRSAPPPALVIATTERHPVDPFPNLHERLLMDHFPGFVEGCHRAVDRDATAVAAVECGIAAGHPGARSVRFESFPNYLDLEEHFAQLLALTVQMESGRPLRDAFSGPCSNPRSEFFADFDYPAAGQSQDQIAAPSSRGHFVCYLDHAGLPRIAWTNVGWMVVAEATGDRTEPEGRASLLAFWRVAGPNGTPAIEPVMDADHAAMIDDLYMCYLLRPPEANAAIRFWLARLERVGYAQVSSEFAYSLEANSRITTPILHKGPMSH